MISCDLGSNTIRFVEIDCISRKRIGEFERIVKTAEGLNQTGNISEKALKKIINSIKDAQKRFDFSKGVVAVATEALRRAKNKTEILEEIFQQTALKFKILTGEEEAFYTNYAVREQIVTKSYMLLDIGGGSTEISFVGEKVFSNSFSFGIVTLTEEGLEKNLSSKLDEIKKYFQDKQIPKTCVATAGTPTTIAAFIKGMDYNSYDYTKISKTILTIDDIQQTKKELLKLSFEERKKWVGVGREDLIITGIEIFLGILNLFNFKKCIVIDEGLREGVALYYCDKKFNY